MQVKPKTKNSFDEKKVLERAKRSKKFSLKDAALYVWTVAKRSVKRGVGIKKERVPLSFFDTRGKLLFQGKPTRDFTIGNSKSRDAMLRSASKRVRSLKSKGRGVRAKAVREAKKRLQASIKDLRQKNKDARNRRKATVDSLKGRIGTKKRDYTFGRFVGRPSAVGTAPRSWDHFSPHFNYYLKKHILPDTERYRVYVEPGKSTTDIWRRHELGGTYTVQNSYPVVILDPVAGPRWEKRKQKKRVRFPKRPFMGPALEKSRKRIPEIMAKRSKTVFR